jgi:hypothetical protein
MRGIALFYILEGLDQLSSSRIPFLIFSGILNSSSSHDLSCLMKGLIFLDLIFSLKFVDSTSTATVPSALVLMDAIPSLLAAPSAFAPEFGTYPLLSSLSVLSTFALVVGGTSLLSICF